MLFHCGELLRLHRWFSHSVSKCHPLFKQHNLFFLLEAFKANSSSLLSFLFGGNLYKNNNIKTGSWKYTKVYWNIRCFTSYSIKAINVNEKNVLWLLLWENVPGRQGLCPGVTLREFTPQPKQMECCQWLLYLPWGTLAADRQNIFYGNI